MAESPRNFNSTRMPCASRTMLRQPSLQKGEFFSEKKKSSVLNLSEIDQICINKYFIMGENKGNKIKIFDKNYYLISRESLDIYWLYFLSIIKYDKTLTRNIELIVFVVVYQ